MRKRNCLFILLGLTVNLLSSQEQDTFHFNFATENESLGESVTAIQPYSEGSGYGFDLGTAYRVQATENGFTSTAPVYFSVQVPEGTYKVTATVSGLDTETTLKAESKRLFIPQHKITTTDEVSLSFNVSVFKPQITADYSVGLKDRELLKLDWDDKLTLEFLGNSTIKSIHIEPVTGLKTLFLVGDSTVTNQDLEPWASWGQFITAYLDENIAVANMASSGASLASFKGSRIDKVLHMLKKDDYVVIEFGHNDEKIKGEGNGAYGLYTNLLTDFVTRIKEKGGIPILITPTQRRAFEGEQLKPTHGDFPDAMRNVAKNEKVTLIDITAFTTQMYEAWGAEGSRKAFVQYPANTFPGQSKALEDNTHFSNFGANEIALAVLSGLRQSSSTLKHYITVNTPPYNPSQPHEPQSYNIPYSSLFEALKPDGN
ncbi:rhamnogalacturonan acetylesterase [Leeuwenhoekiella sp. MAR_2009_132]|uniref:rhamnogalacturonan acetylesterase n=1 Tax=Leeuwenhoekiella sp. MAR_2009_132 TaxID=1392489 RepID=UPI00048EA4A8|nr:rhamnogalacturonan acetylesterase [Leeuwenhoekiella sp. MAR_2009_132]